MGWRRAAMRAAIHSSISDSIQATRIADSFTRRGNFPARFKAPKLNFGIDDPFGRKALVGDQLLRHGDMLRVSLAAIKKAGRALVALVPTIPVARLYSLARPFRSLATISVSEFS